MNKILIVGAGGHGESILDAILSEYPKCEVGFLVDGHTGNAYGYPIVGEFNDSKKLLCEYENIVIAIGNNETRKKLYKKYKDEGYKFPVIKHRTSYISPMAKVGEGSVVLGQAFINAGTSVGIGCILNTQTSLDHDCTLGDFVHISPGSHLCGTVSVGDNTWVCSGSTIIDHVSIGSNVVIGAGVAIKKEIEDNKVVKVDEY